MQFINLYREYRMKSNEVSAMLESLLMQLVEEGTSL